jgi:hypothetical protein
MSCGEGRNRKVGSNGSYIGTKTEEGKFEDEKKSEMGRWTMVLRSETAVAKSSDLRESYGRTQKLSRKAGDMESRSRKGAQSTGEVQVKGQASAVQMVL